MTTQLNASENCRIYTHGGIFHGDDVAACAAVRLLYPGIPVTRVFSLPEYIREGDLILDLGGIYDPAAGRFDHHMVEGHPPPRPNGCPRASFGALWASELGRDICGAVAGAAYHLPFGAVDRVRGLIDSQIVQGIDALDEHWTPELGGQPTQDGYAWAGDGTWAGPSQGMPLPSGRPGTAMTLSAVISGFNPRYDEPSTPADRDAAFEAAVNFMEMVLRRAILAEAATIVAEEEVLGARTAVPQDSRDTVLILPRFVPWQDAVLLRPDQAQLLYVVFPSERGGYCLQQIPVRPGAGEGRKPLPAEWAGRRGQNLADITGLPLGDGPEVFCHAGRFVGGAKTLSDVMNLARLAVEH